MRPRERAAAVGRRATGCPAGRPCARDRVRVRGRGDARLRAARRGAPHRGRPLGEDDPSRSTPKRGARRGRQGQVPRRGPGGPRPGRPSLRQDLRGPRGPLSPRARAGTRHRREMARARRRGLRLLRPVAGRVAGNSARSAAPRIHRRTRQTRATRAMKKGVLFIHGGGEGAYEEDRKMAASLQDALAAAYDVRCPQMPEEDRPEYAAWRDRISQEIAALNGEVILVGHSLGGSILLKYLSEEEAAKPVAGLFLVAAPFWGAEDWEVDEYAVREDFASKLPPELPVFLYHGRDDEVVPFAHLALYADKLPRAIVRKLEGRGHQFGEDLSEVARDIGGL